METLRAGEEGDGGGEGEVGGCAEETVPVEGEEVEGGAVVVVVGGVEEEGVLVGEEEERVVADGGC